eukprot:scaffold267540_cov31-Tisochrysis_lutea.AAC.1
MLAISLGRLVLVGKLDHGIRVQVAFARRECFERVRIADWPAIILREQVVVRRLQHRADVELPLDCVLVLEGELHVIRQCGTLDLDAVGILALVIMILLLLWIDLVSL